MKTCLECDLKARDSDHLCAGCGSSFAYVSDEPDADYEAYADRLNGPVAPQIVPTKTETSPWIKMILACLVLIIGFQFWQKFEAEKIAGCRSQALQANSLGRVLDVSLSGFECEYLVEMSTFGAVGVSPRPPEWMSQSGFELLLLPRVKDAQD